MNCLHICEGEKKLQKQIQLFLLSHAPAFLACDEEYQQQYAIAVGSKRFQPVFALGFPPFPPVLGLLVATGLGKSHTTLKQLASFIEQVGGPVYIFVPTHELGAEQAEKFHKLAAEHGLSAGIIRGRSQPDPNNPGNTMCIRSDDIEPLCSQGIPLSAICENEKGRCPYHPKAEKFPPCGYRTQFDNLPDVVFLPAID
jgi:hypothetical protein